MHPATTLHVAGVHFGIRITAPSYTRSSFRPSYGKHFPVTTLTVFTQTSL
ncbi:hypothetical protein TPCCA_0112a [Treponema paraluiscuniculi Cuniculi A]|uniref:Uncharacterized protein n=2 Tax=Treponema paraluiscuniculi TaxID=53435 RepID=F7XRV4_TREPU|nr:hypothetical protein TPChic_0112a [Treponema pallidum subsp. pallidum str. Chicago]AEH40069.1 hypothetical protein TPCCA_0112a [Treponema paraluiscuniculi Cuniculi A]WKC72002.1 hypothetical protein TPLL2_0112a [Treponema paraluiscuniculi]